MEDLGLKQFYKNKKVFITGHSGFKGTYMLHLLSYLGADVYGYALKPESNSIFYLSKADSLCKSYFYDIRDFEKLKSALNEVNPEIVIHMAAQALVLESFERPYYTYEVNSFGTLNLLEGMRNLKNLKSFVNVTTDKVYENLELKNHAFKEDEKLDGIDIYANSKSVSELMTHSYNRCFYKDKVAVSTVRAGNVIGGGDFAENRIIPDCYRAACSSKLIEVRNPHSVRPYEFVLEPVFAYIYLAMKQYEDINFADCYNIGPNESEILETKDLVVKFCETWGEGLKMVDVSKNFVNKESTYLRLNNEKFKKTFGFGPRTNIEDAIKWTVRMYKAIRDGKDIQEEMISEIDEFFKL